MTEFNRARRRNHLLTFWIPQSVQFRPSSNRTTRPGVQQTTKAPRNIGDKKKRTKPDFKLLGFGVFNILQDY